MPIGEDVAAVSDFKTVKQEQPMYRFIAHTPNEGSTNTITTSGCTSTFTISGEEVVNLSKMRLHYDSSIAAVANIAHMMTKRDCHLDRVKLSTDGGQTLVDISYGDRGEQMMRPVTTPMEEYLSQPFSRGSAGGNDVEAIASLSPSGSTLTLVPNGVNPSDNISLARRRAWRWDTSITIGDNREMPYTGIQYMCGNPVAETIVARTFDISLAEAFRHSAFAVDKDLYLGASKLILQITWAPITRIYCRMVAATGVTAPNSLNHAKSAAATNIDLTSILLDVGYQENPVIKAAVKRIFSSASGVAFPFEYIHAYRQSLTGTSQNPSIPLSAALGQRLKRVYVSAFHATESAATAWDNSNEAAVKITSYQTFLGGRQLQGNILTVASKHDWTNQYPLIKDTPAAISFEQWRYGFTHVDSWVSPEQAKAEASNNLVGYDLTKNSSNWSVSATTANNTHIWYIFVVVSKVFTASNGIITIN